MNNDKANELIDYLRLLKSDDSDTGFNVGTFCDIRQQPYHKDHTGKMCCVVASVPGHAVLLFDADNVEKAGDRNTWPGGEARREYIRRMALQVVYNELEITKFELDWLFLHTGADFGNITIEDAIMAIQFVMTKPPIFEWKPKNVFHFLKRRYPFMDADEAFEEYKKTQSGVE